MNSLKLKKNTTKKILLPLEAWERLDSILQVPQPDPEASCNALIAREERRRIVTLLNMYFHDPRG